MATTLPAVFKLPPVILPFTLAAPLVTKFPLVTLPVATTCPAVLTLPPVIFPVTSVAPPVTKLPPVTLPVAVQYPVTSPPAEPTTTTFETLATLMVILPFAVLILTLLVPF